MTVADLRAELSFYDDDAEVVFEINDDIEPESVTEDKYGIVSVHLNSKLKEDFMCEIHGDLHIMLGVVE